MYIFHTQIWIIIFEDTIPFAELSSAWQEESGISDNGTFLFFWRTGIRARAGFPATIVAPFERERKSTFTSMISHGRHDANNKDEPLSTKYQKPGSDADETLSVSRTISGQRSIPLISLVPRPEPSSFLSRSRRDVHV